MKMYKVNFIFNNTVIFEMSPIITLPRIGEKIEFEEKYYSIFEVIWSITKGVYEVYIEVVQ